MYRIFDDVALCKRLVFCLPTFKLFYYFTIITTPEVKMTKLILCLQMKYGATFRITEIASSSNQNQERRYHRAIWMPRDSTIGNIVYVWGGMRINNLTYFCTFYVVWDLASEYTNFMNWFKLCLLIVHLSSQSCTSLKLNVFFEESYLPILQN